MRATENQILEACKTHGTKAVHDAAYRAMGGHHAAITSLGLPEPENMGDLDHIGKIAFRLMDPEDRASDLADITIRQAQIK